MKGLGNKTQELMNSTKEFFNKYENNFYKYWPILVIILLLITFLILLIKYLPSNNVSKISQMEIYHQVLGSKLVNCSICDKYLNNHGQELYKLSDFYVLSSYKSALTGGYYNGRVSTNALRAVLEGGVRFIDLDIFNKEMKDNTEPVVSVGNKNGFWDQSFNSISFDDCCKEIASIAFNSTQIKNSNDPLFLSLNLYTVKNNKTINKVADIIYKYFKEKLMSSKYSFQQIPIGKIPINNILGKVVILAGNPTIEPAKIILPKDNQLIGTKLNELTNYTWNLKNKDGLKKLAHLEEVFENHDPSKLLNYNKQHMTIVYPHFKHDVVTPKNYNPDIPFAIGCQFICLNFQTFDKHIEKYLEKFIFSKDTGSSFVLKPPKLRYKQPKINMPLPQTENRRLDKTMTTSICQEGIANIKCSV